jgi:MFS superfamily sulfate permease-like transporter
MKNKLLLFDYSILFFGASYYVGIGWSTAITQFPVMPKLNVGNYYLHFVPQVAASTSFLYVLVPLMFVACGVMLVAEWRTGRRWIPLVMLAALIISSCITYFLIFPINRELSAGVTDPERFTKLINGWVRYTWYRIPLWTIEWLSMMCYFAQRAYEAMKLR